MARMYSRRKGKSGSKKPMVKKAAWVKYKPNEIEEIIVKLAKKGYSSARIGLVLRDQYGIPSTRIMTKEKISKILKNHNLYPELPEDMYNLIKRAVDLIAHMEKNKKDYISKRGLELTESKIRRIAKYYKRKNQLPKDWKWDPGKAKLMVK
ncbi:MAG: 30S ribosomal protein S15 [Candidatus Aenigmarchaeota archaeon]|nr:30S ribosomal protein S15 [Candidatus Aenigmarchaeota archaeon]